MSELTGKLLVAGTHIEFKTTLPPIDPPPPDPEPDPFLQLDLDPAGLVIPETNYSIPPGSIYMAPDGSDSAAGGPATPVKSLTVAASKVGSGGTIVLYPGQHRTGSGPIGSMINKDLTIQAYPGAQAWLTGCDQITGGWTQDGARWWVPWNTPSFCGGKYYDLAPTSQSDYGPCSFLTNQRDSNYVLGADPQMCFINNQFQVKVKTVAEVGPGKFCYDWLNKRLYIGVDPVGKSIEATARPSIVLGNQRAYRLRGIGVRGFASNEFSNAANAHPTTATTDSAMYIGARALEIEFCMFAWNASRGLRVSNPKAGTTIKDTGFCHNGASGVAMNGASTSGQNRNDTLVQRILCHANNREFFSGKGPSGGCTFACSAAGMNLANMWGIQVLDSVFNGGVGNASGLWFDINNRETLVARSAFTNNGNAGLFYEISSQARIASNLIANNGGPGIQLCSPTSRLWNNTIIVPANKPSAVAFWIYDDNRNAGNWSGSGLGGDTRDCEWVNNVVHSDSNNYLCRATLQADRAGHGQGTNTMPDVYFARNDHNAYRKNATQRVLWISGKDGQIYTQTTTIPATQSTFGWDTDSFAVVGGDPFFVDMADGDYRIRDDSAAAVGAPLTAEIAEVLGLETGAQVGRGALTWPVLAPT